MSQQYKLPFTGQEIEEKLINTIPAPIAASVGQTVKISAVDANGKPTAWEAVDFSEGGTTSTYTNQLPLATDTDRTTVYDDNGYIDGYRLSSSGGISAQDGMSATGFIPATPGQTIRIKGATPMQGKNNYIIAYKADNTVSKCASMAYDSTGWITPHDGWMKYENGIIIILLTSTMFGSDFNAVRFCSAQLSDDVIVTVDEKITDSYVQPDWNQNDPTAPGYVKNRPFWTSDPVEAVLFESTVVNYDAPEIELIVGQEYTVTLDGVEYVLTAWDDGDGSVVIGSESIWWNTDYVDTEPPFAVGVWKDGTWFYTINEGEEHTLRIVGKTAKIHKIDEKYLPSTKSKYDTPVCSFMNTTSIIEAFPGRWDDYEDWTETNLTKENFDTIIELATLYDENKIYFIDRERIDTIVLRSNGSIFVRICDVQTGYKCLFSEMWEIDLRYDESDGIVYGKQKYRQENAVIEETPT